MSCRLSAAAQSSWPPGRSSLPEGEQPGHAGQSALHSDWIWMTPPGDDITRHAEYYVVNGLILLQFDRSLNLVQLHVESAR